MNTISTLNLAGQEPNLEHGLNEAYRLGIKAGERSGLGNILLNNGTLMKVREEARKIKKKDPDYKRLNWIEKRFYSSGLYQALGVDL